MRQPAVIIINYNTREPLHQSLLAAEREGADEIVVVDNASADGSAEMVRARHRRVTLHANTTNVGYGVASNQGIASCTAPYVVLLNGDACLAAGALDALRTCLDDHPRAAVVGPRLLNDDGSLQPSCYAFPGSLRWVWDNDTLFPVNRVLPVVRCHSLRTGRHDREREVPWIKGAAMAIRRRAFDAIGGFDESFPLFYEETDLCYRLTAAGWQVLFSPQAVVQHHGGASTGDRAASVSLQLFAGQVQYFQSHSPRTAALWTSLLKALEVPAQVRDHVRVRLTRNASERAALAVRLADRRRKIRLDRHRAGEAWRTALLQREDTPSRRPAVNATSSAPERWSPLALWHPDGVARSSSVLGSGCPAKLRPPTATDDPTPRDLVVVCPGRAERRRRGWLQANLAKAATACDADGVIHVVVPALQRRRAAALLAKYGLEMTATVLHLPNVATSRYLLPLSATSLRYALSQLIPSYPRLRRLAAGVLGFANVGPAARLALPATLIARRPGARPLFEWLSRLQPEAAANGPLDAAHVIAVTSWRPRGGPTVLHVLVPGCEAASLVVKVPGTVEDIARIEHEESIVQLLGPAARAAGARLPEVRRAQLSDGRPVLVQTAVAGRPLAAMIAERPRQLADLLEQVSAWLERWNRSTRRVEPIDAAALEREILRPAALVTPHLPDGEDYRKWLVASCDALAGTRVPFTARHNDLTMRNVLLDGEGRLGIVDWETGEEQGLPNGDLAYTVVDAVAAAAGYASHRDAFTKSFLSGGEHAALVSRLMARACRALDLTPRVAELAFHACWIRHAANELEAGDAAGPAPFRAVVELLARHRERVCTGMDA